MHSFVVTQAPAIPASPDVYQVVPETSIGIAEVRQIQHFLSRKPIQSDQNTVIIQQAHLLTVPAQNALLKTLEEPPSNSQIYLVTNHPDQLLPTVLSRVQVENRDQRSEVSKKDLAKIKKLLEKLLTAKTGERLKLIDDQAFTRETALQFLDQVENLIHQDLSLAHLYAGVADTRKFLKANCNVRLCLDNLVLRI